MPLYRRPYTGGSRKLIVAYDVGTSFSSASYCLLDPDDVPIVKTVTRYPAQENVGGDSKIPTIMYYDQSGSVQAVGAETLGDGVQEEVMNKGWSKVERFRLHLHSESTTSANLREDIPSLPQGKTAVQVFADFLQYLHTCSQKYIEETHVTILDLWKHLKTTTEYILTHPNAWGESEQALMRDAAIMAGLIPDTEDGRSRLSFVAEGKAILHFCIQGGLAMESTKVRTFKISTQAGSDAISWMGLKGILIVNAGRDAVDISAHRRLAPNTDAYKEIAAPQCISEGSTFVTRNAKRHFDQLLKESKFEGSIPLMTKTFDKKTKMTFVSPEEAYFIRFGRLTDNAPELGIKTGQLKLKGSDIAKFFEPSITTIGNMIKDLCKVTETEVSFVFFVGEFVSNEWLFKNLKNDLSSHELEVCRPDHHINKAVPDGAVSSYIDHLSSSRIQEKGPFAIIESYVASKSGRRQSSLVTKMLAHQTHPLTKFLF